MDTKRIIEMIPKQPQKTGRIAVLVIILIILIALAGSSFTIVQAGQRGIVLQLGAVKPVVLTEGFHFKIPFIQQILPIDVRVQKAQTDQTAASKDLQVVTTTVAVNFHLHPEQVNKLYQGVGLAFKERIVDPAVSEALKAVTAQYTAEELISKRSEVSVKVKDVLSTKLATYFMTLDEINITEFKFSTEFNNAIEQKQIAEQQALKAKLDLQRIEIEAKQKIESAKAEAESLRLQKQEVTPELVELRKIEAQIEAIKKWDGKLPNVTGGAVPFVDVNNIN
ncbi:MAG TPA: prohibitin family protein [Desulfitobacteriaceae bacterium]|nr:prohibitin family protein [Desulfitobacteriaceae bacterium]